MLETSERCPLCGGTLKADVAGVLGEGLRRTVASLNLIKIVIDAAREVQHAFSNTRSPIEGWFKCVSCKNTSAVCPNCGRAFVLNQRKQFSTLTCPHCTAALYVA
jgi:hypothetical protein